MPGITGTIGGACGPENRIELDAMVECMLHEKFYASGTFVDERLEVTAGWVAHRGSFSDCVPVWNEEKNIGLIFAGETFQDRAEIERLRARGHQFNPGNGSYLVHAYEESGLKFLYGINGWFSGLLLDLRARRIYLFNDRFGLGRIFYHEHAGKIYFSSEAKSLLNVLPHLRSLDLKSVGEFFSCGSVLQNRTLFSGVSLLPPGSVWGFSAGEKVRKGIYFEPRRWEEQPALSELEYYENLKETWKRILPRYFGESDPVALSLTGGVDSRMLLAWAPRSPGQLPCYTFGGRYRECNDVRLARKLATLSGQPHETIPVDGDFLSEFPALAEKTTYITDGSLDVSGAADLFVQRRARQIAPIRITGTNGGEMLRRLVSFKPALLHDSCFDPEMKRHLAEAPLTYAEELKGDRLSFTSFKQAPWHMNSKFVLERSQLTLRMPYFDNDLVALSYQVPPALAEDDAPALRLIADGNPALERLGTDRGVRRQTIPGIGRARHLAEMFTFKAEYAYDIGMPQWLARMDHCIAPLHVERLFLGRHKFHHFRVFYRDELSRYLQEVLLDPRTLGRSFLRRLAVEELVRGHVGGYRNYTSEIHKLLSIELVQRQLVDRP